MPRPLRKKFAGAKYHVTLRGNARQTIFHCQRDYTRFREQLEHAVEMDGVLLYAWACLPNHVHLLVETPQGNIDRFMQRLSTAYSMYHRYKHDRPGHCLQGRYKAKLVAGDLYLLRLTRYIHLNPIKISRIRTWPAKRKIDYLSRYPWSSYRGYVNKSAAEEFVDYRWLHLMARRTDRGRRRAYQRYVESCATADDRELMRAMQASPHATGDEEFVASVEAEMRKHRRSLPHPPDIQAPAKRMLQLAQIEAAVVREFGIAPERLHGPHLRAGAPRAIFIELACRYSGQTQRAVAKALGGISEHAVGKHRQRLRERLASDRELNHRFLALAETLRGFMSNV